MAPAGPIRTAGAKKKLIQVGRKSYCHSNQPIGWLCQLSGKALFPSGS
jgi:hypothetical protein